MSEKNNSWYSEPYVWLLIAFPMLAVIGGFITLVLAIDSNDGLVVDDYYREGLMINRVLDRDREAARLQLSAVLKLAPERDSFVLNLRGNGQFTAPAALRVGFLHATRKGHDRHVIAYKSKDGSYSSGIQPLIRGHWYVQIETNHWRLLKSVVVP